MSEIHYIDRGSMPVVSMKGASVFPGMVISFDVANEKSQAAFQAAMGRGKNVLMLRQKEFSNDDPGKDDFFEVGTICTIRQILKLPQDGMRVLIEGTVRGVASRFTAFHPYAEAMVEEVNAGPDPEHIRFLALVRTLRENFEAYAAVNHTTSNEVLFRARDIQKPGPLCDFIASNSSIDSRAKQDILDCIDVELRVEKCCVALVTEIEFVSAQERIKEEVSRQMDKNQKEYMLREQIRAIQNELGEGEVQVAERYREQIRALIDDEESQVKLLRDVDALSRYGQNPQEASITRNYLDTVLALPWKAATKDRCDIAKAKKILDEDHYGLKKVKERILDFLSVRCRSDKVNNQIICLVGPPGVGKTSIARSVARALNRKYVRVALGGVKDEAEIRGHRKTYLGSMPGRVLEAITRAGVNNPLMLLDEIDKLSADYKGDPSSALLEVLDGEQNCAFRDHYVEVPFDLSKVMFLTTANDMGAIPSALMDRMEIIEIGSYTEEEKVRIAQEHLWPKQLKLAELNKRMVKLSDDMVRFIIRGYTHEAGVRTLERRLASCCRKVCRMLETDPTLKSVKITEELLHNWFGPDRYRPDEEVLQNKVGIVNGLAWTAAGGELLQVEVNVMKGKGEVRVTGNLGDVMKESCQAAVSYIRSKAEALGIDPEFYAQKDIHIHFPEGAVPKDGPSAGITITTAIVSALTGREVKGDIAMTGEVTLRGRVLQIGGLREKSMAAFKAGIRTIVIPWNNAPDLYEVEKVVADNCRFEPVRTVDEVLALALLPKPDNSQLPGTFVCGTVNADGVGKTVSI